MKAFLFDLDGVLVDTAHYHFLAWKKVCDELNIEFTEQDNEKLKGIDRRNSLRLLLKLGNKELSEDVFEQWLVEKNTIYLSMIESLNRDDLFDGVIQLFDKLKQKDIKIGLGSASKNALLILKKLEIEEYFDSIVDGNMTTLSKPDPQVFLLNADRLSLNVEDCAVLEDSEAGIDAAITANMKAIGIGSDPSLNHADIVYTTIKDLNLTEVLQLFVD